MAMQVEHHILVRAPAERIFGLYRDVSAWHTWDPDTRRASLDGPFAVGTRGWLTPTRGRTVPMQLTRVEPDTCFTVESKIPLFRMVFEHELLPQGDAVRVTHRVTFSGPLTFLLGRMLVRQLHQGLPVTLARLQQLAEHAA
jgi:Polyketide cyclase / dehydrase and lipid transport